MVLRPTELRRTLRSVVSVTSARTSPSSEVAKAGADRRTQLAHHERRSCRPLTPSGFGNLFRICSATKQRVFQLKVSVPVLQADLG